jgi:hypothetical protein
MRKGRYVPESYTDFKGKPDAQCTYNLTLRCVVAVGKQLLLHILSVCLILRYPASEAHASSYIVICGQPGSTILFHIISYRVHF